VFKWGTLDLVAVERLGTNLKLAFVWTNRGKERNTFAIRTGRDSTYLVDNLGNRYWEGQFPGSRRTQPGIAERVEIVFGGVSPSATHVNLVINMSGEQVTERNIGVPQ
jgi:hypothetical protein